ncbi:hypothetical protein AGABI2DRAFT_187594 [Agaricus bisporus var. bisporus H97]|uniref:hypothetical protein n=1 Tax=Agaricus bisporus var. bisporus (strain H97 / ATCC MYA-4626 / FGSC 10389) TaxID=936046 RepID=UPI00029F50EE|nr:hypothetical protein AGABI2DRAFT_187594 [Agaricus bisporus var. bisporus H97]EKV43890.1 hypothetical protein AGABI2DRAFT_187594 [Agaricus bisporus var. bisporus H97]
MPEEMKVDNGKSNVATDELKTKENSADYAEAGFGEVSLDTIPDGGWRAWGVVLGVWIFQFVTFGYTNAFGVYNDFYVREYLTDFESSQTSWIGSVQLLFLLSCGLFSGRAFDAGHFRKVMLGGSVLLVFCLFMLSITHPGQYYQVFLSHGLGFGLAAGITFVPGLAVISHWFRKRRPIAIGIATSGSAAGGFIHPIMLNALFHGPLGFHNGVRVSAGFCAGLLIVALLLVKTRLPPSQKPHNTLTSLKLFSREPSYVATTLGTVLLLTGLYYPFFFVQLNAIQHGLDRTFAFYTIAIVNGTGILGRVSINFLVHRLGVFNLVIFCTCTCSILIFCTLAVDDVPGTVIFSILFGYFSSAYIGLLAPMLGSLATNDKEIGARMGICFTFTGLGGLIVIAHAYAFVVLI